LCRDDRSEAKKERRQKGVASEAGTARFYVVGGVIGRPTARNQAAQAYQMCGVCRLPNWGWALGARQEAAAVEVVEVATAAKRRARVREVPEASV